MAVLIIIGCILWWNKKDLNSSSEPAANKLKKVAAKLPASAQGFPEPMPSATIQRPGGPYERSDPRWKWYDKMLAKDRSFEWRMPISFYGKVIDQNGKPLDGAKIRFQWSDISIEGTSERYTQSDSNGGFFLEGVRGKGLSVYVSKDGYYQLNQDRFRSFEYAEFSAKNFYEPDPNRPVIFHLRKKGEGASLSMGEIEQRIVTDGTPVCFDLLNHGRISSSGQLKVAAITNKEKYPPRVFNWWAKIAVPEGGLLENHDEFPFHPPESGYEESIEFNMPSNAAGWLREVHRSYYIKFGEPARYGRIQLDLDGASSQIGIKFWVNPDGSTLLEPRDK
ncbi:MAG: carboxypeptidase-like regulatory domain-containing protein [Chthoniobacteraceae bacterium]